MTSLYILVCIGLLQLCLRADAQSVDYWGETELGCSASWSGSPSYFNEYHFNRQKQWIELWTVTFSNKASAIGGMINIWWVHQAPLSVAVLNAFLTDGTQNPPVLATQNSFYPIGFNANGDSPCIRNGPCNTVQGDGSYLVEGSYADGNATWSLTFKNVFDPSAAWCTSNNTNTAIGLPSSESLSWGFMMPAAEVTGNLEINGVQHDIDAYGEVDHPYGVFLPFVTLKFWNAAQLYDAEFGLFYYVSTNDKNGVARFQPSNSFQGIPAISFQYDEFSIQLEYSTANPARPILSYLNATQGEYTMSVKWSPLVNDISWNSVVEDISFVSVHLCASSNCFSWSGNGWSEVVQTSQHDQVHPIPNLLQRMGKYSNMEEILKDL